MNPSLSDITLALQATEVSHQQTTSIIAIDGCGGAGKTTLAQRLATRLNAQVIHTDDFASWTVPFHWHQRVLDQVLTPLSQNLPTRYQRYDWDLNALAEWHSVPVQRWVILEGVSSSRRVFRPFLRFAIFVDAPQDVRLKRGLARDGQDALPLWKQWQAAENDYIATENPKGFADVILDGTCPIFDA